jgi:dihydroxyacetone kinase
MKRIIVLLVILVLSVSAVPARAESVCAPGEIEIDGMCIHGPNTCARGEIETANGCIARPPICCVVVANHRFPNRIQRLIGRQLILMTRFALKR